jgi:4-amino-4-deoxy-L-arabinose transferase-like glycosyltransferase
MHVSHPGGVGVPRVVQHLLLLTCVGAATLFVNLGGPRLWDRDEPRNAACAREMLDRGDWVVPTFNGELRVPKPILKYWLMISAYKLFGVNEFAARFWSAVFALATVWATYFLGRRLFDARTGLWAGLILASSLLFVTSGHMAKADAPLTFFSTLAVLIFVYGTFRRTDDHSDKPALAVSFPQSWPVVALLYAAVGMAALAKGLPGLLLPPAVIGLFLLIARSPVGTSDKSWRSRILGLVRPFAPRHFLHTFWLMRPITTVVVVLAVAGPWYVLVGLRTHGEFLRGFFLDNNFGRAMQPMEGHSGPFLLYYPATIALGFFPWSVLLPAMGIWLVTRLRQADPWHSACLLLACWIGLYVVAFSAAQTKLPGYIVPCFPALALLMGGFVREFSTGLRVAPPAWLRVALVTLGVAGLAIGVGGVIATRMRLPGEEWLALIGLVPVIGAGIAFALLWRGRPMAASVGLAAMAVTFSTIAFGFILVRVGGRDEYRAVFAAIERRSRDPHIGSFDGVEPSWVFYANQQIQPLIPAGPTPASEWKVTPLPAGEFFAQDQDRFIITTEDGWKWLRKSLPADARVLADSPRFLSTGRWLLIGHEPAVAAAPSQASSR